MAKTPLFSSIKRAALTRRTFLKGSLATAALALPLSPSRGSGGMQTVILGAGFSGLGAACTLQSLGMPYQIYEAAPRVGGRVWTKQNINGTGQFAEFGGELIDTDHHVIVGWAKEMGLEIEHFQGRAQSQSEELYFHGGQRYNSDDLTEGLLPLADYARGAIAEMRAGIDKKVYLGHQHRHHPGVVKYDRMSLSEFLDDVPNLDPWVKKIVDVGYNVEFGLETDEQTAINMLELFDPENHDNLFGISDESMRIKGGNGQLIQKMFERACPLGLNDGRIHMNHQLVRIREHGSRIELTFAEGSAERTVTADRVICTIPFSVLRHIEGVRDLTLSPVKRASIFELGYGTNAKVTMDFSRRFWRESAVSTTATIFTNLESQSFWESTRGQSGTRGVLTNFRGGTAGANVDESFIPSVINDLGQMYDGPGARDTHAVSFVTNWSRNPFLRGSYSCMMPGQTTRCWGNNHVPELNGRLVFAGEHTSLEAVGYMEGALRSGIRAAGQIRHSVTF